MIVFIRNQSPPTITSSSSSPFWMMQPRSMKHGINYLLETDTFLATLSNCIQDDKCHIQYLHTWKTGGTTIEKSLFASIFPNNEVHSCCREKTLKQFRNDSHYACMKPFNSYQVMGKDFREIVQTCLQIYHENNHHTKNDNYKDKDHGNDDHGIIHKKNSTNTTNGWMEDNTVHRMVILATFRDPIQQSLSAIHQMCNKFFHRRSPMAQQACRQCSYEKDTEFWENNTIGFNEVYDSLYKDVILWQVENNVHVNANDNGVGVGIVDLKLLTLGNVDITPCFTKLVDWLSPPYSTRLRENLQDNENQVKNPELLQMCDFGFHSAMMKHLSSL